MSFLTVDTIYKSYEGELLLQGISLEVRRGEIVSLLGPSGSGKTTLLRVIAGLEPCESGRILLDGRDVTEVPTHRRGIVLMFQEYALFPHRTVAENVAFGLRMASRRHQSGPSRGERVDIPRRVDEMLALVGLQGFGSRNVVELSGGERQRVALARSLAPEPRLLLLDEPLGSLDRTLRERLLEELALILRRVGVTAISVTHDQAEAFALADRVALLHDSKIIQIDAPETILRHPATPWVARFLGFDNLFPAHLAPQGRVRTPLGTLVMEEAHRRSGPDAEGSLLILPWGIRFEDEACSSEKRRLAEAEPPVNRFTARVTRRLFQGRTTKVQLEVGDAALSVTLDMSDALPVEGDVVHGWIDPAALRWYMASQASR